MFLTLLESMQGASPKRSIVFGSYTGDLFHGKYHVHPSGLRRHDAAQHVLADLARASLRDRFVLRVSGSGLPVRVRV